MPHLNVFSAQLIERGPKVQVYFSQPQALRQIVVPASEVDIASLQAKAMVDTGASHTIIRTGLLENLDLNPIGSANLISAGSVITCSMYSVTLSIPQGEMIYHHSLQVFEVDLHRQPFVDCLLGRDVLSKAIFTYNGAADSFSLSF